MNKDGDLLSGPYGQLKRTLCQSRDKITTPSNKRPSRLRDNLLEFEVCVFFFLHIISSFIYLCFCCGSASFIVVVLFDPGSASQSHDCSYWMVCD